MSKLADLIRRKKGHPFCSVVVVAAGSSHRMGQDKLMAELGGMPVLARTLRALDRCSCIDEIVVVTKSEKIVEIAAGTGFMQGIFVEYGITVDDDVTDVRNGGFGSTTGK